MPKINIDLEKCTGCGTCVDNCPVMVFELKELKDYPNSKKSVPIREDECILCRTCETSCPTGAIIVEE